MKNAELSFTRFDANDVIETSGYYRFTGFLDTEAKNSALVLYANYNDALSKTNAVTTWNLFTDGVLAYPSFMNEDTKVQIKTTSSTAIKGAVAKDTLGKMVDNDAWETRIFEFIEGAFKIAKH